MVDKEHLTEDAEFGKSGRAGLLSFVAGLFKSDEVVKSAAPKLEGAIPTDVLRSIGRLRGALDVKRINRTYVSGSP